MIRLILGLIVVTVAVHAQAEPLVYLIEQERRVHGSVDDGQLVDTQTVVAPDAPPWIDTVMATVYEEGYFDINAGSGQNSETADDAFRAYGVAETTVSGSFYAWTSSESVYRVRFAVPKQITYHLTGSLIAYAEAGAYCCNWEVFAQASVSLDMIAGPTLIDEQAQVALIHQVGPLRDIVGLDHVGTLSPGVYELEVRGAINAPLLGMSFPIEDPPVVGESTFVVDLAFALAEPEPECVAVDINEDGTVDMADFWRMQDCFTGP